jgi:Type IV secretion-system coupling protein DNA-binding domain
VARKFLILLLGLAVAIVGGGFETGSRWTHLQRYYFATYVLRASRGVGHFYLLYVLDRNGWHIANDHDVFRAVPPGNATQTQSGFPFVLSEWSRQHGAKRLEWREFTEHDNAMGYGLLRDTIYHGQSPFNLLRWPIALGSLLIFGLFLFVLIWDRKAAQNVMRGKTLRGPCLVTVSAFNLLKDGDGIGFETVEQPTKTARIFRQNSKRDLLRIPRNDENCHFLLMGDSGTGKSSLIRQLLSQIRIRGEGAIVYDPALEFLPHFYDPTSDTILNPTDRRMPFWTPSDEVQYPAEAAAIAGSLFPDKPRDNNFFTEAARKIFAHLLRYRPTPQELTLWMKNMDEVDQRVVGTELEAIIQKSARAQRAAVQGTFNQAAAAFQLLPCERDSLGRWSAARWAKERRGWIFIPTLPVLRESLRPLLSMWLDCLILRLMEANGKASRVWFVLDELSSLQKLPQLPAAVTESRKSNVCFVVGFQGRSQLEAVYGEQSETMLSQPMTKIFLRTSEPNSADWISRSIGEVEVMRLETTLTRTLLFFSTPRQATSAHLRRSTEHLVMASTIAGLDNLVGYLKSKNLVVPMSFPYVQPERRHPAFLPRALPELGTLVLATTPDAESKPPVSRRSKSSRKKSSNPLGPTQIEIFK